MPIGLTSFGSVVMAALPPNPETRSVIVKALAAGLTVSVTDLLSLSPYPPPRHDKA